MSCAEHLSYIPGVLIHCLMQQLRQALQADVSGTTHVHRH